MKRLLIPFAILAAVLASPSCTKDLINDPGKVPSGPVVKPGTTPTAPEEGSDDDPSDVPGEEGPQYEVDSWGYATFTHEGFQFKLRESRLNTEAAKAAIEHMKADIDKIVSFVPEKVLEVMQTRPIWLEENNSKNPSAAWYHTNAGYPGSYGDIPDKGKCVEITNYSYYVSWSDQNQPFMVFHELCHMYHDHGLGGSTNQTIKQAYRRAKNSGRYAEIYYRYNVNDPESKWTKTTDAYCMNTEWEYWSEMSEAYWGENDYYPFNYDQLKEFDPDGFAMCEEIWGPREF